MKWKDIKNIFLSQHDKLSGKQRLIGGLILAVAYAALIAFVIVLAMKLSNQPFSFHSFSLERISFVFVFFFLFIVIFTANVLVFVLGRKRTRSLLIEKGFVPQYTETALFLTGFTFLLTMVFNYELFEISHFTVLAAVGILLSIYHAFAKRAMFGPEKFIMLLFIMFTNLKVGLDAGSYIYRTSQGGIFAVLPALNIFNAFALLLLFRMGLVGPDTILDKQAGRSEVILGMVLVLAIFLISHFVFENYWAITFSLCIVYAMNMNKIIGSLISPD